MEAEKSWARYGVSDKADRIIMAALKEDIGTGDITSSATTNPRSKATGVIVAKSKGVLAGLYICARTFQLVNRNSKFELKANEGSKLNKGQEIIEISGSASAILKAERTALNLLGRISGIASLTHKAMDEIAGTEAVVLDTRKTMPGLRYFDKYGVKAGGGQNHRFGLYDMFLIKENHITAAGSVKNAVEKCKDYRKKKGLEVKIVTEAETLEEAIEAVRAGTDRILIDNMTPEKTSDVVSKLKGKVEFEVSGGINLDNIREYAETGVDYISMGMLTHSVPVIDYSLLLK